MESNEKIITEQQVELQKSNKEYQQVKGGNMERKNKDRIENNEIEELKRELESEMLYVAHDIIKHSQQSDGYDSCYWSDKGTYIFHAIRLVTKLGEKVRRGSNLVWEQEGAFEIAEQEKKEKVLNAGQILLDNGYEFKQLEIDNVHLAVEDGEVVYKNPNIPF